MEMMFTTSAMDLMSDITMGIYEHSRRQSERDIPDLGPFRHRLMSVKELKAKERCPRIYCVFLSLSNSYLIKHSVQKREKRGSEVDTPLFTTGSLRGYLGVIEEALLCHLWLQKDLYFLNRF